jgi:hypothetical protein
MRGLLLALLSIVWLSAQAQNATTSSARFEPQCRFLAGKWTVVLSPGPSETEATATYWDNEGHAIEYTAAWHPTAPRSPFSASEDRKPETPKPVKTSPNP